MKKLSFVFCIMFLLFMAPAFSAQEKPDVKLMKEENRAEDRRHEVRRSLGGKDQQIHR
jgi:hypothetical protein